MAESPLADWSAGAIYPSEIDGHPVVFAVARRGPHALEAILRDGDREFRAKADLLLDPQMPSLDALMGSVVDQWRRAQGPAIWNVLRGE